MSSRKGEKKRLWSQTDMDQALSEVRSKKLTPSQAAKIFKVPRKTLTDRLENKVKDNCKAGGGGTILSEENEKSLCTYIEYMATRGFPLTVNQIMMYAWCLDKKEGNHKFGVNGPCYSWWLGFKARHPDSIKLRKPDSLDRGRAIFSTVDNLRYYFQLLKGVLEEGNFFDRPQDIYNCDETVVDLNKSAQKVVVPRRFKTSHSRQVASSEHVTIHCCISAAGNTIPPFIIYKSAFPGGNYTAGGPDGALYGKQKSGFMDSELFVKWFTKIFIPYARPTPENSVLLLVDGHSSHCSPEVITLARENNVILLALAPHTTHLCQPLDVAVYKSFKTNLSKLVKLGQALKGDLWISKTNVARMLKQPFEASMSMVNIKSGFRKCGIFPFNPNGIDKTQLFRNKLIPEENVDLSLPPGVQNEVEDVQQPSRDATIAVNEENSIEVASVSTGETNNDVVLDINDLSSSLNFENNVMTSEDLSAPVTLNFGLGEIEVLDLPDITIPLDINHNFDYEVNDYVTPMTATAPIVQAPPAELPIIIEVNTRSSQPCPPSADDVSIYLSKTAVDVGTQTNEDGTYPAANPLVTHGLIPSELADVFRPPDAKIPVGRKRPLRIKSKARIMTAPEVVEDLVRQEEEIELRTARTAGKKTGQKTSRPPGREGTVMQKDQASSSSSSSKKKKTSVRTTLEDNNCYICEINFYDVPRLSQRKWVGCETNGCPHWVCESCLPPNFNYESEYICDYCNE